MRETAEGYLPCPEQKFKKANSSSLRVALQAQPKNDIYFLKPVFIRISFAVLIFLLGVACSFPLFANPQGGQVVSGAATIQQIPNSTVINQTSQKAIINWQSFNINKQEATHFQQPAGGIALNRISPTQGASQIYGTLTATGQIILVNPAGIYFGPSAFVNVGGLIASTADLSNQSFLSNSYHFVQDHAYPGSAITNAGKIIAQAHGLVALMGENVSNNGFIQASLGQVILATGSAFTLTFAGNNLISFAVDEKAMKGGAINNTGVLSANGGQILVTANAASKVLDHIINMQGVAQAKSVHEKNGEIILSASPDSGIVRVAANLDVSGKKAGEVGGHVKITGEKILIDHPTTINASGNAGGGEIFIGGNYQGKGPLPNATATVIAPGIHLLADANVNGNGGKVIVWSNELTKFYGNISARGGISGGNGGFVETSSHGDLEAFGMVDASSSNGVAGQWLLDPSNVTIANATANGSFNGGNPNTFSTSANNATVNVATINASLNAGTDVTILTTPGGTQAGNITVSSAILKSAGAATTPTLTLNAVNNIIVSNTISSTSGGLNVSLISGNALTLNSAVTTNGGSFASNSQNATTLASSINTGAGTVAISANQDGASTQAFTMSAGSSITTTNSGASAVSINVNTIGGGTGSAALRDITTGNGGTITVNTGNSASGGDITMPSGTLNVGNSGTINLNTTQTAGRNIGTNALNIQMIAGNLITNTGSGGAFITNSGTGAFNLNGNTGTGSLTLTSLSSSGITNGDTLTIPGTLTIAAGATQNITLNSAANNIGTLIITSGKDVNVTDTAALKLGSSTISGNLAVTAGGAITQTGGLLSVSGTPTFTVTSALSDILLASFANSFSTTPVFTNNGNIRDIALQNNLASASVPSIPSGIRNLTLTFNNAGMVLSAITLTGNLITAASGSISQSAALNIAGTSKFTINTASSDLLLSGFANVFGTTPTITNNGNIRDLAFERSGASGLPNLPSGLRNLTLIYDTTNLALGAITLSGNLNVTAHGNITSNTLNIAGTPTFTVTAANSDITLANANNNFSITPVFTNNGNIHNLSLRNTNASAAVLNLPSGMHNLTLTYNNAAITLPATSLSGTFTGTALGSLLINGNISTGGTANITVNSGSFAVANGATFTTNNANLNITATDINLNSSGALHSNSANTTITQNTAGGSIGLGNTAGTMTISGSELQRITANNLTLDAPSNGSIMVDGISIANSANISNTVTLAATAGTLGSINFLNGASSFKQLTANADNGVTVNAPVTTTVGNLNLNAHVGGSAVSPLTLSANLAAAGSMTLSADNAGIILGGPVNLSGNGITINPTVSGNQNLTINSGSGTARFNSSISVGNLTVGGNSIAMDGGSITTTGNQTYNAVIDFGTSTTLTGQNLTFNKNLIGSNQSLIINGQPGNNIFTLNGILGLASINVNGSSNGNNSLALNTGSHENWSITGNRQGNITSSAISGSFNFTNIGNLFGNSSLLQLPSNTLYKLTFNGATYGSIDALPINFNQFNAFSTANINDPVFFIAHGIYNVTTGALTVNGVPISLSGFNYHNFSGNITFVSGSNPAQTRVSIPSILTQQMLNNAGSTANGNQQALITNNVAANDIGINNITFGNGVTSRALGYGSVVSALTQNEAHAYDQTSVATQLLATAIQNPTFLIHGLTNLLIHTNNKTIASLSILTLILDNQLISITVLILLAFSLALTSYIKKTSLPWIPFADDFPSVSFQMRTALNSIIGFVKLVSNAKVGGLSSTQKEFLMDILDQANELLSQVSKIEQGEIIISKNKQSLAQLFFKQRTCLNSIIGFATIISEGQVGIVSTQQKLFLSDVLSSSNDILQLINVNEKLVSHSR